MKYIWLFCCFLLFTGCDTAPPAPPTVAAPVLPLSTVSTVSTAASNSTSGPVAALLLSAKTQDTLITLSWNSLPNVSGYIIYRDGNTRALTAAPITGLTYDDLGLTNGRTYTYTVAALDGAGQVSARSAELKATPRSK